ncbi:hypothetical protein TNCV_4092171 [Trichonephila clavipes]|nr:hypothetical protein TNCV_4092171 [Trichonephila clavipes]
MPENRVAERVVLIVIGHVRHIMTSSPVLLKTHCVGERCTLREIDVQSRAQNYSRLCSLEDRREREGGASSGVVLVTLPWFKITRSVSKSPRLAEQCEVNNHSLTIRNHKFIHFQYKTKE